jgi:hypothetical protein
MALAWRIGGLVARLYVLDEGVLVLEPLEMVAYSSYLSQFHYLRHHRLFFFSEGCSADTLQVARLVHGGISPS